MKRSWHLWLLILAVLFTAALSQGCGAYMRNRGHDLLDIIDLGITITPRAEPDFALYFDFFNLTPLGYASVDGKLLGLANRQAGWLDYQNHSWGVLAWGSEKHGAGKFNPADPHLTRHDQRGLTERKKYDVGFVGSFAGQNHPPGLQYLECNRILHLGWIGIMMSSRPVDIIDFILGWTTLDILGDDLEK